MSTDAPVRVHNRYRPRFTDEDRRQWRELFRAGWTVPAIAKRFACSGNTIYHHLTQVGLYVPGRERAPDAGGSGEVGACIRCGVVMRPKGLCFDCCEVLGYA